MNLSPSSSPVTEYYANVGFNSSKILMFLFPSFPNKTHSPWVPGTQSSSTKLHEPVKVHSSRVTVEEQESEREATERKVSRRLSNIGMEDDWKV